MFATIQPIMFVVLFVYVFGGSIEVPGYASYKQYVIPGIFAQTVLFGSIFTGVGIAEDLSKGFIDRLRSLPMYPSAVLIGRTMSDVVRNVLTFVVMLVVAFIVGFRFEGIARRGASAPRCCCSCSATRSAGSRRYIGLSVGSAEAANSAGFIWMFPLTFVSSAFVDPENMPELAAADRRAQPVHRSSPTPAARSTTATTRATTPWIALAWAVGITIVFATLADAQVRPLDERLTALSGR